jgi:hypothetical protein
MTHPGCLSVLDVTKDSMQHKLPLLLLLLLMMMMMVRVMLSFVLRLIVLLLLLVVVPVLPALVRTQLHIGWRLEWRR